MEIDETLKDVVERLVNAERLIDKMAKEIIDLKNENTYRKQKEVPKPIFEIVEEPKQVNSLPEERVKLMEENKSKTQSETQETNDEIVAANEEEFLFQKRKAGFRRSSPQVQAVPKYTCNNCNFSCEQKLVIDMHLKSHNQTVGIQKEKESISTKDNADGYNCKKCAVTIQSQDELKAHRKSKHPTFRPCRNYPDNECVYGSRCDFRHVILKPNQLICWDCGLTFEARVELMIHRKQEHPESLQICRKLKDEGYCSRNSDDCWNSHNINGKGARKNDTDNQVFHNRPKGQKPPLAQEQKITEPNQIMMEMLNMMKQLLAKNHQ